MTELTLTGITATSMFVVSGIVLVVIQAVKMAMKKTTSKKWLALTGVGIGVVMSFLVKDMTILGGIMAAGFALGLYRGTELTFGNNS